MLHRYLGFIINLTELKRLSDAGCFAFLPCPEFLAESRSESNWAIRSGKVRELKCTDSKQCKRK